jgi:hypothetical protein
MNVSDTEEYTNSQKSPSARSNTVVSGFGAYKND